jgi:hypothetical protein
LKYLFDIWTILLGLGNLYGEILPSKSTTSNLYRGRRLNSDNTWNCFGAFND